MSQAIQKRSPRSGPEGLITRYRELLEAFADSLGADWQAFERQTGSLIWRYFFRRGTTLPTQGWKIHISVAAAEAPLLFEKVLPVLRTRQASFKLPNSVEGIAALNYGQGGQTQLGKIVTVYPADLDEAVGLAQELDRVCPATRGPAVMSDVALRPSGAVSVRYGAFGGGEIIRDSVGRASLAILLPDGSLEKDGYTAGGAQPSYAPEFPVAFVLPKQLDLMQEIVIGESRYLPLSLLHSSPISRVVLGLEISSCRTVVLKIVRPGVGGDLLGLDACDKLKNEYAVLTALARLDGVGPLPHAYSDNDPSVLVIEDIEGTPLHQLSRAEQVESLPLLAEAITRLHQFGYAHRDIKLSNALLTNGGVRLVDFGLAAPLGAKEAPLDGTNGYVPPEGPAGYVDITVDIYALGASVAHVLLGRDPVALPVGGGRLIGMLHLLGARHGARLVSAMMAPDPRCRPSAATAAADLRHYLEELMKEVETGETTKSFSINKRWCKRAAWEGGQATRLFLQPSEHGRWWRNTHFQSDFACEGINLGAAGIILGLISIDQAQGRTSFNADISAGANWLSSRKPDGNSAGMFTGDAGVALALGLVAKRLSRPELLAKVRLRLEAAAGPSQELDLFCGAAGVVWAGCLLSEILHEQWPLEIVQSRARAIIDSARIQQDVIVWPPSEVLEHSDAPYTGAAHGSAGIAMALAIYGKRIKNRQAVDLAMKTFQSLRLNACTPDGRALSLRIRPEVEPTPAASWCHGTAGYLWCLLQAFGDSPTLRAEIDWAVQLLAEGTTKPVDNPTYCHGLSGSLELWRMLAAISRHRKVAVNRAAMIAAMLRLLCQRLEQKSVWCSEEPKTITPDLWIGFLAPATALALHAIDCSSPLLSAGWLTNCGYAVSQ